MHANTTTAIIPYDQSVISGKTWRILRKVDTEMEVKASTSN